MNYEERVNTLIDEIGDVPSRYTAQRIANLEANVQRQKLILAARSCEVADVLDSLNATRERIEAMLDNWS